MEVLGSSQLARSLFDDFRRLSYDGVGVTRDSYGAGETAAIELLRNFALSEGLASKADDAGNLILTDPADRQDVPAVWIGSHIDSVPQGGNYDGLAGILAGTLLLVNRRRGGRRLALPINVIAFRGEESAWFGKANAGSAALLGQLKPSDLQLRHRTSRATLGSCMQQIGANIDAIGRQQMLLDRSLIRAYIELHIEQGPVMVQQGVPIAVVSSIRGNFRHCRIECLGDAQHSGVVPRELRHDAVFAVADLIMQLDRRWQDFLKNGTDLVVTTGTVYTDPAEHAVSRVPGRVMFSLEARSASNESLERFYRVVCEVIKIVERDRGVRFKLDDRVTSAPAQMDATISGCLAKACARSGVPFTTIPSGAGHDAALFSNAGIPSGMLFVRNQNGSHNPDEDMQLDDFMLGLQVLADTIQEMSK